MAVTFRYQSSSRAPFSFESSASTSYPEGRALSSSNSSCVEASNDEVQEVRYLAKGGEGCCTLVKYKGQLIVKKVIHKARQRSCFDYDKNTPREVRILRDTLRKNDRIINLLHFEAKPGSLDLYYEYYPGGDLHTLIMRYLAIEATIPEAFIWHVYLQSLEALAFIHFGYDRHSLVPHRTKEFGQVLHRDIKTENILLRLPLRSHLMPGTEYAVPYPSVVLADFGMATDDADEPFSGGTKVWQPPETPIHSNRSDVWSAGAVVHALMFHGEAPIAPLPEGYVDDTANRKLWYDLPEARQPYTQSNHYTQQLMSAMHLAFVRDEWQRPSSFNLLCTIEQQCEAPDSMWRDHREPLEECIFGDDWPDWMS